MFSFLTWIDALITRIMATIYPMPQDTTSLPSASQPPEAIVVSNQVQTAPTPIPSPTQPPDKVRLCAVAQQAFEGWYLPGSVHDGVAYPNGSDSYQHNDPGNCRNLAGVDITFASYAAGFAYLEDYIRRVAAGKHPAYPKGGATTIMEYTHIYTGDKEPAPTNYAIAISRGTGLSTDSPMSALLD